MIRASWLARRFGWLGLLTLLLTANACHGKRRHGRGEPVLRPLAASAWLVDLDVPGFLPSKVAVPVGAIHPRAIVIALHGAADRPEWSCGELRGIAGPEPFIVCPSGERRTDYPASDARYTFGSLADTERELRASLAALKSRFGAYLKTGSVTLVGFELGAERAALLAHQEPSFFSRLLLIDPAPGDFSSTEAALFAQRGGERLLFVCHGAPCRDDAQIRVVLARRAGAEAELLEAAGAAPSLDAATIRQIAGKWRWFQAPSSKKREPASGPLSPPPASSGK